MPTPIPGAVVVGVDGSASSRAALDWALVQAARDRRPIHLVSALGVDYAVGAALLNSPERVQLLGEASPGGPASGHLDDAEAMGDQPLDDELLELSRDRAKALAPGVPVTAELVPGRPGETLVRCSETASLVVTGARGRGSWRAAMLGSVSLQVAMHAHCPVVVVREPARPETTSPRVVVGVDGSANSAPALQFAFEQAETGGVGLTVVHAWWLDYAQGTTRIVGYQEMQDQVVAERSRMLTETLAGWRDKYPEVHVREHLLRAHPVEALVDHSVGAQLVVVGSRGLGGFTGLVLGSVSHGVLHRALCPVAVVRERKRP